MKTTFETALDQHEITDFFKGNGIYFARGSDWGTIYMSATGRKCEKKGQIYFSTRK